MNESEQIKQLEDHVILTSSLLHDLEVHVINWMLVSLISLVINIILLIMLVRSHIK